MAQVKFLKIDPTTGLPTEMDTGSDDATLASYTVTGGGPVLDANLDMNNGTISDADGLSFTDPATDGITQTAGVVAADDLMAKERENTMTTAGGIAFPVISDAVGEVDAFRMPALAGVPTAAPTNGGEGHMVWDSTGDTLYAWDGAAWIDLTAMGSAPTVDDSATADEILAARDALYYSAADNVSKADASAESTGRLIGFATAGAADTASVTIRKYGVLGGFAGLTAGARQFLSETAGAITETPPTSSGAVIVQAGFAKSTTTLDIQIQYLGERA